jgi:hypothetical protein
MVILTPFSPWLAMAVCGSLAFLAATIGGRLY